MVFARHRLTVTAGVTCLLAIAGSVAGHAGPSAAGLVAIGDGPNASSCSDGPPSQSTAGTITKSCQGAGGTYIGPQWGQVVYMVGANVVGGAQLNGVAVSSGAVGNVVRA